MTNSPEAFAKVIALGADLADRISKAVDLAAEGGGIDGGHHKQWYLDQILRTLMGCPEVTKTAKDYQGNQYMYRGLGESEEYKAFREDYRGDYLDEWQEYEYGEWDEGIAP